MLNYYDIPVEIREKIIAEMSPKQLYSFINDTLDKESTHLARLALFKKNDAEAGEFQYTLLESWQKRLQTIGALTFINSVKVATQWRETIARLIVESKASPEYKVRFAVFMNEIWFDSDDRSRVIESRIKDAALEKPNNETVCKLLKAILPKIETGDVTNLAIELINKPKPSYSYLTAVLPDADKIDFDKLTDKLSWEMKFRSTNIHSQYEIFSWYEFLLQNAKKINKPDRSWIMQSLLKSLMSVDGEEREKIIEVFRALIQYSDKEMIKSTYEYFIHAFEDRVSARVIFFDGLIAFAPVFNEERGEMIDYLIDKGGAGSRVALSGILPWANTEEIVKVFNYMMTGLKQGVDDHVDDLVYAIDKNLQYFPTALIDPLITLLADLLNSDERTNTTRSCLFLLIHLMSINSKAQNEIIFNLILSKTKVFTDGIILLLPLIRSMFSLEQNQIFFNSLFSTLSEENYNDMYFLHSKDFLKMCSSDQADIILKSILEGATSDDLAKADQAGLRMEILMDAHNNLPLDNILPALEVLLKRNCRYFTMSALSIFRKISDRLTKEQAAHVAELVLDKLSDAEHRRDACHAMLKYLDHCNSPESLTKIVNAISMSLNMPNCGIDHPLRLLEAISPRLNSAQKNDLFNDILSATRVGNILVNMTCCEVLARLAKSEFSDKLEPIIELLREKLSSTDVEVREAALQAGLSLLPTLTSDQVKLLIPNGMLRDIEEHTFGFLAESYLNVNPPNEVVKCEIKNI